MGEITGGRARFVYVDHGGRQTEIDNPTEFFAGVVEVGVRRALADQSRVIAAEVRAQVDAALAEKRFCVRPVSVSEETVALVYQRIKALGEGNYERGVERMADNQEFVLGVRRAVNSATTWVGRAVVGAVVVALLGLLTLGFNSKYGG